MQCGCRTRDYKREDTLGTNDRGIAEPLCLKRLGAAKIDASASPRKSSTNTVAQTFVLTAGLAIGASLDHEEKVNDWKGTQAYGCDHCGLRGMLESI